MLGSNSIEGYRATRSDALAVVAGKKPLSADDETAAALAGFQDAMTYVLNLADDPFFEYESALIRALHYILLKYDLSKYPGRWRPGPIYVTAEGSGQHVYEGPNVRFVDSLMTELVGDLRSPDEDVPCMVRAAMGHLNLVMIHPFEDGNGRMGRILQTLLLVRERILAPSFCSIEEYLGRNPPAYYRVLTNVGAGSWHPERDAREWVHFCLRAHFFQARTLVRRMNEMAKLWDILQTQADQYGFPDRLVPPMIDAALGFGVRNSTYRSIADITDNLASKDLKTLCNAGFLVAKGERRGRHYVASERLKDFHQSVREKSHRIEDPFDEEYLPGLAPLASRA